MPTISKQKICSKYLHSQSDTPEAPNISPEMPKEVPTIEALVSSKIETVVSTDVATVSLALAFASNLRTS